MRWRNKTWDRCRAPLAPARAIEKRALYVDNIVARIVLVSAAPMSQNTNCHPKPALFQLLRRLPIIMLEDAQLHPFFSHCVWLMAAHAKGFPVQESHIQLLQVCLTRI